MSNAFIPNTASIPNILFDYWMHKLTPAEFKVLMCIARKTYGWRKNWDLISIKQIQEMTGLSRKGITKNIERLVELGLVNKIKSKTKDGDDAPNKFEININCQEVNPCDSVGGGSELSTPGVVNSVHYGSELSTPTKDNYTKPTKTNIVCNAEPLVADSASSEDFRKCTKFFPDGSCFDVSLEDLISYGIMSKKNWTVEEMNEAWNVLFNYKGAIREWKKFVEGTVNKIRTIKKNFKITEKTQNYKFVEDKNLTSNTEVVEDPLTLEQQNIYDFFMSLGGILPYEARNACKCTTEIELKKAVDYTLKTREIKGTSYFSHIKTLLDTKPWQK